nr:lysylphosphatidylglycerol synthase transmembrane domain-containing protein [Ardenticatena sp.]
MRRFLLSLTIGLVIFIAVFWNTDWGILWASFRNANPFLIGLAFLLTIAGVFFRAIRWRWFFWPHHDRLRIATLFDVVGIGYLVNMLFPARAGDVVRSYLLSEWHEGEPTLPQALSATVFERLFDTLVIVAIVVGLLPVLPLPSALVHAGFLLGGGTLAVILIATVLTIHPEWGRRQLTRLLVRIPRLHADLWAQRLFSLLDSFAVMHAPSVLARILFWSVPTWGLTILTYWLVILAFGLNVPPTVAALTIVAAAFGLALPSPGGLGPFEGAVTAALLLVGMEENIARSVALALHGVNFFGLIAAGMIGLGRRGMGYRQMVAAMQHAENR